MQDIVIKNYAYILRFFSPLALFLYYFMSFIVITKIMNIHYHDEELSPNVMFLMILVPLAFHSLFITLRGFKKNPPIFRVTNDSIHYEEFEDEDKNRIYIDKDIKQIVSVKYILNIYATFQEGNINKDSLIKRFFKDDLGEIFINTVLYIAGWINFLGLLPILIFQLLKNREPLWLLFRNFMIEFDDGTVFLINSTQKSTYQELVKLFSNKDFNIRFLPVLSVIVDPYFEESLRKPKS
ncbi:MAG: hypothetical protein U9N49_00825 [Campylobacterota bacterium]|nr:hypothetical protein [Campylobacterota bacterium]